MARAKLTKFQWSVAGLVVLGLITAVAVVLALLQHRVPTVAATPPPAPVPVTPTPTPAAPREGLAGVADVINSPEGASILVIGDGTGDEDDEWVAVWARDHLATNATVSYRAWDRANNQYGAAVRTGSTGPTIELWNASVRSPDMAREPDRIARAWQDADVVLLSYGHRRMPSRITAEMDAVAAAVRANSPDARVVVLLQNPDRAATEIVQRDTVQAIKTWADANAFPTVDVYGAFMADATPRNELVESDGSPTVIGSRLFSQVLSDALAAA